MRRHKILVGLYEMCLGTAAIIVGNAALLLVGLIVATVGVGVIGREVVRHAK